MLNLNTSTSTCKGRRKPDNAPIYVNKISNLLPTILKQLLKSVEKICLQFPPIKKF